MPSNLHSQSLTEMYHLLSRNNFSLDYIFKLEFKEYLLKLDAPEFVSNVFVYGFEVRDEEPIQIKTEVIKLLEVIQECYEEKFKDTVESDDSLLVKYNLGLINSYLYFCQRQDTITEPPVSKEVLLNSNFVQIRDDVPKDFSSETDINLAINYLRMATKLADETINIAKGIYLYHTIRAFEYIFEVFMNYSVDNDNKPIDLDSFYVFSDALDSNDLWLELMRQNKNRLKD